MRQPTRLLPSRHSPASVVAFDGLASTTPLLLPGRLSELLSSAYPTGGLSGDENGEDTPPGWRGKQPSRTEAVPVLYIVATPIGNLADLSPRAKTILSEATVIACEDSRVARKLMHGCAIHGKGRLVTLNAHNESDVAPRIIAMLHRGGVGALISDAGTPGVSDPGRRLIALARSHGVLTKPVPGPCAAIAALSCCGLDTSRVLLLGFPPARRGARRRWLDEWRSSEATRVLYEAPHRIVDSLRAVAQSWGGQVGAAVCREMTKRYEETLTGTLDELVDVLAGRSGIRGEFTVIVAGSAGVPTTMPAEREQAIDELAALAIASGAGMAGVAGMLARALGMRRSEAYARLLRQRDGGGDV